MLLFLFCSIIAAIALVGSLMYIIIMGPSRYHRDGIIGKLYNIITGVPLYVCGFCVSSFFGCNQRKGRAYCSRCAVHTIHDRNWFMVICYIVLVWTVEFLYLGVALPRLQASLLSKSVSWGLVLVSELMWLAAVFADPGTVTPRDAMELQRQQKVDSKSSAASKRKSTSTAPATTETTKKSVPRRFPFSPAAEYVLSRQYVVDGMIYAQASTEVAARRTKAQKNFRTPASGLEVGIGQDCSTCQVARPSRSKHCRLCHRCVRRYDHHCPWINNDVAEGTMRYFLGFLFFHAISCTWAVVDLWRNIRQFLIAHHAWGWVLRHPSGRTMALNISTYIMIVLNFHILEACLFFFAVFIGLVLYGFWSYQMTFALANLTVNDLNKMDDTADFIVSLPTLELVYREAKKVQDALQLVAERKPTALMKLQEPPLPMTLHGYQEGGPMNAKYRAQVKKMVVKDLRGLFDRGMWNNMMEIIFPYSFIRRPDIVAKAAACV